MQLAKKASTILQHKEKTEDYIKNKLDLNAGGEIPLKYSNR